MTEEERRRRLQLLQAQQRARAGLTGELAPQRDTGVAGHAASGFNTDLAATAGLPVDAATAVIEGMQQRGQQYQTNGVDPETGRPNPLSINENYQPFEIARPVGGAASNLTAMDPFIADDAPNTTAERYVRSIGEDVGASALFVAAALPAVGANMARYLLTEGASSLGSGAGAQAAEDLGAGTGGQVIAALLGGGIAPGLSYATRPRPQGEAIEGLTARRDADYGAVRASSATLPTQMRDDLLERLRGDIQTDFDEVLHPRAARALSRADTFPANPSISEIDELRQFLRNNVAGSTDPAEARIGQRMVGSIDDFLSTVSQSGALGGDAQETVAQLLAGRDAHRRLSAVDDIVGDTGALTRAERRAATSGTGGNVINTMRQNIRAILDNPNRRRGFNSEEIAAMERVVAGSRGEDLARLAGRLSPDSGALPLMGNMAALAAGSSAGPGGLAAGLAPGVVGMAGQAIGEAMTRRNINQVVETILNGRPLTSKSLSEAESAVVRALLGSQAAQVNAEAQRQ
jgi:hypothetical protein